MQTVTDEVIREWLAPVLTALVTAALSGVASGVIGAKRQFDILVERMQHLSELDAKQEETVHTRLNGHKTSIDELRTKVAALEASSGSEIRAVREVVAVELTGIKTSLAGVESRVDSLYKLLTEKA